MNKVLEQDINDFVARVQSLMDKTVNENCNYGRHFVQVRSKPGTKYIAIDSGVERDGVKTVQGVFCFVAAGANASKAVGPVIMGDVLKAAGYSAPAKHARGNIYDDDQGMKGMAWTGPAYLK